MQTPLLHRAPGGQEQTIFPPQPLSTVPHSFDLHGRGVQPHRLGVPPPPQVSGRVQWPQLIVLPQPSSMGPHVAPAAAQVVGLQGAKLHL